MPEKLSNYAKNSLMPKEAWEEKVGNWLEKKFIALGQIDQQRHVRTFLGVFKQSHQDLAQTIREEPEYSTDAKKCLKSLHILDDLRRLVLKFELQQLITLSPHEVNELVEELITVYKITTGCVPIDYPESSQIKNVETSYTNAFPALQSKNGQAIMSSKHVESSWPQRKPLSLRDSIQSSQNKISQVNEKEAISGKFHGDDKENGFLVSSQAESKKRSPKSKDHTEKMDDLHVEFDKDQARSALLKILMIGKHMNEKKPEEGTFDPNLRKLSTSGEQNQVENVPADLIHQQIGIPDVPVLPSYSYQNDFSSASLPSFPSLESSQNTCGNQNQDVNTVSSKPSYLPTCWGSAVFFSTQDMPAAQSQTSHSFEQENASLNNFNSSRPMLEFCYLPLIVPSRRDMSYPQDWQTLTPCLPGAESEARAASDDTESNALGLKYLAFELDDYLTDIDEGARTEKSLSSPSDFCWQAKEDNRSACRCIGVCSCEAPVSPRRGRVYDPHFTGLTHPIQQCGPDSFPVPAFFHRSLSDSNLHLIPSDKSAFRKIHSVSAPSLIKTGLLQNTAVFIRPARKQEPVCLVENASMQQQMRLHEGQMTVIPLDSAGSTGETACGTESQCQKPESVSQETWSKTSAPASAQEPVAMSATQSEAKAPCPRSEKKSVYVEKSWKELKPKDEEDNRCFQQQTRKELARRPIPFSMYQSIEAIEQDATSDGPECAQVWYVKELEERWMNQSAEAWMERDPKARRGRQYQRPLHPNKPCSFFLEGCCFRSDCKYSHDLSAITCHFWEEGQCFKGELCPFLHGYSNRERSWPRSGRKAANRRTPPSRRPANTETVGTADRLRMESCPQRVIHQSQPSRRDNHLNGASAPKKRKNAKRSSVHQSQVQ